MNITYEDLSKKQQKIFNLLWDFINDGINNNRFIFSGVAGSGKTTILNILYDRLCDDVVFITLTGKAAQVMRSKGIDKARTIHSYLYVPVTDNKGIFKYFRKKNKSEFNEKLIVVDESSMITKNIYDDLMSLGIKIIFTGDINQIPSISNDDFNIMSNPDIRFEEIHRQAENNPIILMARYILDTGKFTKKYIGNNIQIVTDRDEHINKYGVHYETILCGTNRNRIYLNKQMRKINKRLNKYDSNLPYIDDKIICLQNNYGVCPAIYNGDTFIVKEWRKPVVIDGREIIQLKVFDIDGDERTLYTDTKTWHGGQYKYDKSVIKMDYAYALTVHKSQGSEYKSVCYIDEDVSSFVDQRKFRYTAITRAKELLTIIL